MDDSYFSQKIPSIYQSTQHFNSTTRGESNESGSADDSESNANEIQYDSSRVTVVPGNTPGGDIQSINDTVAAMHEIVSNSQNKVIGFDTETEVETHSWTGHPTGRKKKVGLLQFCYRDRTNKKRVLRECPLLLAALAPAVH